VVGEVQHVKEESMLLAALLVLGCGPMGWRFPWWVWALGIAFQAGENACRVSMQKKTK